MKGRTTCPKCGNKIILEIQEDKEKHQVTCPICKQTFFIVTKCKSPDLKNECYWQEYGEPRKTILSNYKYRTKKPKIAAIILLSIFALGITSAIFSDTFIDSSMNLTAIIGIKGSAKLYITDYSNDAIGNISVKILDKTVYTNNQGIILIENIEPGIQIIDISGQNYSNIKYEVLITPILTTDTIIKIDESNSNSDIIKYNSSGCTIFLIILSIFVLLGVLACYNRMNLKIAIVSSWVGIFTFGFFFISSILGIIAFMIIMNSREEFENVNKGKIF